MESIYFGQGRVKGHMQLNDLVLSRISKWLSTIKSTIPAYTAPTTAENATSRKLTISRGLDEEVSNKQFGVLFQQNMSTTIQDLKTQIGQLANIVSHLQSGRSGNLPSQIIPNSRGNESVVTLRSGKELPQITLHQEPRPTDTNSVLDANSEVPQEKSVPLPFPTWTPSARKPETDEEPLRMFQKIPKYAKFLKELCVHKRKKLKGGVKLGGICQDPEIFPVPCTIDNCTFVDAMLDLGALINVMPTSIYKSLNFDDLKLTRMTIQLANRSVVQPLGILEDVLVKSMS
ncbi:hypothetical protein CR513_19864, partial [Mucuna pruriens]